MTTLEIAVFCLALNVYHEARGEPVEGQYAVAQVTMNRARHIRKDVCRIVLAPSQFSWTKYGVFWMNEKPFLNPSYQPGNTVAWKIALNVAKSSIRTREISQVGDATFYHAYYVRPDWQPHVEYVLTIGDHHFYRGDGKVRVVTLQ